MKPLSPWNDFQPRIVPFVDYQEDLDIVSPARTPHKDAEMSVTHIVLIHAAPDADQVKLAEVFTATEALKDTSVKDGKGYVRSVTAGVQNSKSGRGGGITHAIVIEFDSAADRDYFATDPAHDEVTRMMLKIMPSDIATVQVIDFTPGVY
ncbi:stress responsive A/B barrel domain-containing protein [Neohortaea acidophila]|uniref:Stress responsive A/B barrel domain-containing protein n=1 Tax=Neohortaea acidophila TaxID=245834 RepID=A0A6A6PLS9_9PEZI|nr:stress responsive A/B barrel domain-containing protein [Neohortaea acidophila]KAF2480989.1 stress responsive A/B barrel domain-containing protein [Neohortaea acidophila]